MNEQEFATFLKSISNYNQPDDILLETMDFIKGFYMDFKKHVENNFEDKLGEFKVRYGRLENRKISMVRIEVQKSHLSFNPDFEKNVIDIKYHGKKNNGDELYIKDNEIISKKYEKKLSKDLLESYLDLFEELKND